MYRVGISYSLTRSDPGQPLPILVDDLEQRAIFADCCRYRAVIIDDDVARRVNRTLLLKELRRVRNATSRLVTVFALPHHQIH
jgi:hypothetical protein